MIPTLCANLDELDEPEAKASLIWIIGEYAKKIDNADELLSIFVDTFTEESYPVRVSALALIMDTLTPRTLLLGTTADIDGGCEVVPTKTRQLTRARAEGPRHGNERMRFTRRTRSGIYLLATPIDGPWCSKGRIRIVFACSLTEIATCRPLS